MPPTGPAGFVMGCPGSRCPDGACLDPRCGRVPGLDRAAWFCGNSGFETHAVGEKEPNAWGLLDVHGNVSEWVWDIGGPYEGDDTDPLGADGPAATPTRVFRGGSVGSGWATCRSAARVWHLPYVGHMRTYDTGFRLARTAPPP